MSFLYKIYLPILLLSIMGVATSEGVTWTYGQDPLETSMERVHEFESIPFKFGWSIMKPSMEIEFLIVGPSSDYVSLGISENGGMIGADIVTVHAPGRNGGEGGHTPLSENVGDGVGGWRIEDMLSVGYEKPKSDKVHNVDLLGGMRNETHTIAKVRRPIHSCDSEDFSIHAGKSYVVVAYGSDDAKGEIRMHAGRDSISLNLLIYEDIFEAKQTSDWVPMDIRQPSITLDSAPVTQYICTVQYVDLGFIDEDVEEGGAYAQMGSSEEGRFIHAVGADMAPGSEENVVHHIMLYHCPRTNHITDLTDFVLGKLAVSPHLLLPLSDTDGSGQPAFDCSYERPAGCETITGFARGAGTFVYPAGIGQRILDGIYLMEVHYENPHHLPIQSETSGIRVWTSKILRKEETAVLAIHDIFGYSIAPHHDSLELVKHVPSTCLRKHMKDPRGTYIIAGVTHMHFTGYAQKVDRIKADGSVEKVFETNHFDFGRQVPNWQPFWLTQGDSLRVHCYFNTTKRDEPTYIGLTTEDEMCHWFAMTTPPVSIVAFTEVSDLSEPLKPVYCGGTPKNVSATFEDFFRDVPEQMHAPEWYGPTDEGLQRRTGKLNLCKVLSYAQIQLPINIWSFHAPLTMGALAFLSVFALFYVVRQILCLRCIKQHMTDPSSREIRKMTLYVCALIVMTAAFCLIMAEPNILNFSEHSVLLHVNSEECLGKCRLILLGSNLVLVFYVYELVYRSSVTWDLILHHLCTMSNVVVSSTAVHDNLSANFYCRYGAVWLLQAATDHPLYIALLVRKFGAAHKTQAFGFHAASVWHMTVKTIVVSATLYLWYDIFNPSTHYLMANSFGDWLLRPAYDPRGDFESGHANGFSDWRLVVMWYAPIALLSMLLLQTYQAVVFWRIGNTRSKSFISREEKKTKLGAENGKAPRLQLEMSERKTGTKGEDNGPLSKGESSRRWSERSSSVGTPMCYPASVGHSSSARTIATPFWRDQGGGEASSPSFSPILRAVAHTPSTCNRADSGRASSCDQLTPPKGDTSLLDDSGQSRSALPRFPPHTHSPTAEPKDFGVKPSAKGITTAATGDVTAPTSIAAGSTDDGESVSIGDP